MKTRLLSLLLTLAIVLQIIPATVFATEDDTRSLDELMLTDEGSLVPAETVCEEILFEDTSLREENVKHFRMKDGSYRAVVYDTPVHYLDDEGNWQEYDNTLHTIDRSGEATSYRVENGDSVRLFAAEADSDALLSVSKGEYALTISPVLTPDAERPVEPEPPVEVMGGADDAADAALDAEDKNDAETTDAVASDNTEQEISENAETAVATTAPETQQPETAGAGITVDPKVEPLVSAEVLTIAAPAEEEITDTFFAQAQPEKLYSALEYENLLDGATLRYENYANSVKESIIIPARQDDYTYSFRLQATGLTPELLEDDSIVLTNAEGKTIYTIPSPYTIDANNKTSYEAFYTLEEAGDGWLLTVTADAEWMNAKERAYPVVLDPTLREYADNENDLSAAFVRSGYADSPAPSGDTGLYVGNNGNVNKKTRSYFHFNHIPQLPEGSEMTNAIFSIYQFAYEGGGSLDVGIHALSSATKYGQPISGFAATDTWKAWASGLTWTYVNNGHSATHNSVLIDRKTVSSATGGFLNWDITTLAASWYDSPNDGSGHYEKNIGFAMIPMNEDSVSSRVSFYGPKDSHAGLHPSITITYRSSRGIESDFTYQTAAIGNAGTAHIGDFDMQTTLIVPIASVPSEVMPFSLSLVYNSDMANKYFTVGDIPYTKNFSNMKIGKGWKLSIQETVYRISATRLVYTDGDGTEHYYVLSGSTYYEEGENTRLSMIESGSAFVLSDEYGNQKFFNYGYLTETRDAYGNSLFYCYDGNGYSSSSSNWKPWNNEAHRITAVYRQNKGCTAEKILTITYAEGTNLLQSITPKCDSENTANRTYHFSYTSRDGRSTLDQITLGEDKILAQYAYHYGDNVHIWEKHKLASAYDVEANYGIEFGYSYTGNTKEIFEYVVTGSGRIYGTKMHGYKRSHLLAVYRNYGKDQVAALDNNGNPIGGDDYLTFKVLSQTGRTICAYTTDALETRVLGSSAASYTSSTNRKANNLLAASAYTGQPGVNLLRNGDAENVGSYWSSVTTSTAAHRSGSYAFVLNAQYPSFYQLADLAGKEAYTFSGYVRLDNAIADGGVYLALLDANTGTELARSQSVNVVTGGINNGWQRLTVTYKPSSYIRVKAAVISTGLGSNTAYADCLQLEREDAASTYNLVETGSFDQLTSIPAVGGNIFGWYYAGNVSFVSGGLFGSKMAKIYGRTDAQRISQNITVNAPAGSTFLLSGWGKADALPGSVPAKSEEGQAYFGLVARIYYADGTSEPYYFSFNPYFAGWQERSGIMMPSEANQSKSITSVTVVAAYDNNINTAYFDNISLRLEPSQTYRYDENGNPVAATQPGTGSESATYAANGIDLTSYTAANGSKYTYTYNSAHDVTTATIGSLKATTTYNAAGNVTGSKLSASGTSLYMESSAGISTDRNYTTSVTDANGYTTTYAYDANGQLSTATNAKGQVTTYTYDPITLRTNAVKRQGVVTIGYNYENGRLTALDRESYRNGAAQHQYYYFAYNAWGQPTTTKVGNRTLSTNTYYDYAGENTGTGGNLKTTTYGNNDSVSYFYDELDRLIRKEYIGGRYVTYTYNAEGQLAKLTYGDGANEKASYLFEYDSLGRLVRSSEANGSGTIMQRTEHIYDEYSRLKRQSWALGSKSYSEAYTYNDGTNETGNLATMTTGTGDVLRYTYDPLKRLQKVTVKDGNTPLFSTAYAYRNIDSTRTTQQVEFRNVRLESDNSILEGKKYEYDSLGNIVKIRQSTSPYNLLIAYEYDAQNQLTSEIHYNGSGEATANITVAYYYDYDAAGNLLKVEKGTVNSAGTLTKTTEQTYTYNDTDWRDLLTELNDTPIVYEGQTYDPETNEVGGSILSGNPKYYNGWNFDWQHGRELASAEQNDGTTNTTLTYAYDADGIRTNKIYTVKTYEETRHTVTFVADGVTVKTMTVNDGYILQSDDYPTVPAKEGYVGVWNEYTAAISEDLTVLATYRSATHTVSFYGGLDMWTPIATITVEDGYVLKSSDYPAVPPKGKLIGRWRQYTSPIYSDIHIFAEYTRDDGTMSIDGAEQITAVGDDCNDGDAVTLAVNAETTDRTGQTLVSSQTVLHEYLTLSGKVVRETVKTNNSITYVLDFLYDESGRPFAMNYSTNGGSSFITYYYILNLQGDVVKLVTSSGSAVATYEYDAWGNILSKSGSMADKNPLRYRGYYYDSETGFYYLQSRYYDPTMRRFLNADSFASTGQGFIGTNMFAYCGNNPVSRSDITGGSWLDELIETAKEAIRFVLHAGNTLARKAGIDTAALGAPFLQMEADKNGVYHAAFNCWQQVFGYADLYDSVFDIGTSMNTDQFEFSANGENYVLWVWKADYINLGAGAELGIYYGGPDWWQADPDLAMDMSLSLYYQGKNIGSYHGLHWWPTAFNPAYQNVQASDLTAVYTVKFDSPTMYNGFAARHSGRWICDPHTYTAVLTYH